MTLRLSPEETDALRATAAAEGRSMQEVAIAAVNLYTSNHAARRDELLEQIATERAGLLERLRTM